MKRIVAIVLLFQSGMCLAPTGLAHFFYARPFFGEPRLEKPFLSTFEITLFGGHTSRSFNSCQNTVRLFDMYGPCRPQDFATTIPLDMSKPENILLYQLSQESATLQDVQALSYSGTFRTVATFFEYWQNICHGFFTHIYVPLELIQLKEIRSHDLTPNYAQTTTWLEVIKNFDKILNLYNLSTDGYRYTTWGDCVIECGWTSNNEKSPHLDFADITTSIGVVLPTGKKTDPSYAFSIPSGYDGHTGCIITGECALGTHDWFTWGLQGQCIIFADKSVCRRFDITQTTPGFIVLPQHKITIKKDPLWHLGSYIKADHISHGFSLLLGISFDQQEGSSIYPANTSEWITPQTGPYALWNMTTFHIQAECDFATDYHPHAPRFSLIFNIPLEGKRTFKNAIYGTIVGAEFSLCH